MPAASIPLSDVFFARACPSASPDLPGLYPCWAYHVDAKRVLGAGALRHEPLRGDLGRGGDRERDSFANVPTGGARLAVNVLLVAWRGREHADLPGNPTQQA